MPILRLKKDGNSEYIDKKSVFIGFSTTVENEKDAQEIIKQKKKEYHDAKHVCFAYVTDGQNVVKYSDDGEPQGTAGQPILSLIQAKGLSNTLVVVVRYFGGVLLGSSGLLRAYRESALLSLNDAEIVEVRIYDLCQVTLSYAELDSFLLLLEKFPSKVKSKEFQNQVFLSFMVDETKRESLLSSVKEQYSGKIKIEFLSKIEDFI